MYYMVVIGKVYFFIVWVKDMYMVVVVQYFWCIWCGNIYCIKVIYFVVFNNYFVLMMEVVMLCFIRIFWVVDENIFF